MQIKGKVVQVLDLQKGTSARGPWQKRYAVIETESGKYPKRVSLMFWGDLAEHNALQVGNQISSDIDIESREYNGRWYTDVKAKNVIPASGTVSGGPASPPAPPTFENPADTFQNEDFSNDLPF